MEKKRKTRVGRVVSDKMDKTIIVSVMKSRRHPLYKKTIRSEVKYKVHDEKNQAKQGDEVKIVETRPLSKEKRWRILEILIKREAIQIQPEEILWV